REWRRGAPGSSPSSGPFSTGPARIRGCVSSWSDFSGPYAQEQIAREEREDRRRAPDRHQRRQGPRRPQLREEGVDGQEDEPQADGEADPVHGPLPPQPEGEGEGDESHD